MATSSRAGEGVFALPGRLADKAAPALIAPDEQHLHAVETCLRESIADAAERLEARRRARSGANLETMERDQDIHRLTDRLRTLSPTERTRRRRQVAEAEQRERMSAVVADLIAADDSDGLATMLRQPDLRDVLVDGAALPEAEPDELAGPFAHIVVDEAQELTDAQWQMLLSRCPAGSFTIVGDRAQARHGFAESWTERLRRIGLTRVDLRRLTINYRTPAEVMARADPVIRAALPDANVPTSIRRGGQPVLEAAVADRDLVLTAWLARHQDGIACVIGDLTFVPIPRVSSLTPELAKGLEFDLVVLVESDAPGGGVQSAVDRYVAMTRTTAQLVLLS